MRNLTQALNYSMEWLERHLPEYAGSFLPGLTFNEVLERIETLGFPLPNELYELYQWRNGTTSDTPSIIFPTFEFIPLDEVVETIQQANNDLMIAELFTFNDQPLLPFMGRDGRYCAVIISQRNTLKSPVVYIGKQGGGEHIAFSSMTNMMCSLAECFETGAYYLDIDGYIDAHPIQVASVLRKNNPQLVKQALTDIRLLLTDFDLNFEMQIFISRTLQSLERLRPPESLEILNEVFERYRLDTSRKGDTIRLLINRTLTNLV
jgi:hypothetical protein